MDAEWRAHVGGGCLATGVGLGLLGVVAAVLIPRLIPAHKSGYFPTEAVQSLKRLHAAETLFLEADKELDGVFDFGTLAELSDTAMVDSHLGSGVRSGYRFDVRVSTDEAGSRRMAVANPVNPAWRFPSFATNYAGVIHYAPGRLGCNDACQIPPSCRPVGK